MAFEATFEAHASGGRRVAEPCYASVPAFLPYESTFVAFEATFEAHASNDRRVAKPCYASVPAFVPYESTFVAFEARFQAHAGTDRRVACRCQASVIAFVPDEPTLEGFDAKAIAFEGAFVAFKGRLQASRCGHRRAALPCHAPVLAFEANKTAREAFETRAVALEGRRWRLASRDFACDNHAMAIEDYVSAAKARRTGHAPSRVRTMLQIVGNQLQERQSATTLFAFVGGKVANATQLLGEIEEALGEWKKLDDLILQEQAQRQRIDARISVFVEFFTVVRRQIRQIEGKRRRPLTAAQKVVAAAKLRETRRLRRTMGKRQKKALKS
jgi:hypothetical protein